MVTNNIRLEAGFDKNLVEADSYSTRYLVAEMDLDEIKQNTTKSIPLNLAIVIDHSGSMAGQPLDAAKKSAIGIVECLRKDDILSVVSFDDQVTLHLDGMTIDNTARDKAIKEIESIRPGGATNLSDGWFEGAKRVALTMENNKTTTVNSVLLLTDGMGNVNLTEPDLLATHANELLQRGISSSVIGIGPGYHSKQVSAIANSGGGSLHHASLSHEIIEIVSGEMSSLKDVSASNLRLRLDVSEGVSVTNFNGFPRRDVGKHSSEFTLGRIVKGIKKEAVFMIELMPEKLYTKFDIGITLSFTDPSNSQNIINDKIIRQINVETSENNRNQRRNIDLSKKVVKTWHSWILHNGISYNDVGSYKQARDFIIKQKFLMEDYCFGLSGCERLIDELDQALRKIDKPISTHKKKEALNLYHKRAWKDDEFRSPEIYELNRNIWDEEDEEIENKSVGRNIWSEIKNRIINKQSKV